MPSFHINRSRVLIRILHERGWYEAAPDEVADLAMWDTYRAEPRTGRIQLLRRRDAIAMDNKICLYRHLRSAGAADLMPETYTSVEEFAQVDRGGVWFLKPAHLSGGRRIGCFTSIPATREAARTLGCPHVIQREVEEPMLIDGFKFTIRSFAVLFGDRSACVHDEALLVLQPATYQVGCTDPEVQFKHDRARFMSSEALGGFSAIQERIRGIVRRTVDALARCINPENEPGRYQFCGLDFVATTGGEVALIEVNAWPNLGSRDAVQRALKERVLRDFSELVIRSEASRRVCSETPRGGFRLV